MDDTNELKLLANQSRLVGIGLRAAHYADILSFNPDIPFLEILADNYLCAGGPPLKQLDAICERYPVSLHCIGMSLGSINPIDFNYLKKIKLLAKRTQAILISDHLCWVHAQQYYLHELMPLPFSDEIIKYIVERIKCIQDFLEQPFAIENVSSYITYRDSSLSEGEVLTNICEQAQCKILLDINNIFVNSFNHQFNSYEYIDSIEGKHVAQYHLAGYEDHQTYYLDHHGAPIAQDVWNLYDYALNNLGSKPTIIERDNYIPTLNELLDEVNSAEKFIQKTFHQLNIFNSKPTAENKNIIGNAHIKSNLFLNVIADINCPLEKNKLSHIKLEDLNDLYTTNSINLTNKHKLDYNNYFQKPQQNPPKLLKDIQAAWLEFLFSKNNTALISHISAKNIDELNNKINIYYRSIHGVIIKCLSEIYPVCLKMVGKEFFSRMATDYFERYPSLSGNLNKYGEYFSAFIADYKFTQQLFYLAEVASLEWCWHLAFHGADYTELNKQELINALNNSEIAEKIVLALSSNAQFLQSSFAVDELWELHHDINDDWQFELIEKTKFLFIHRPYLEVMIENVSEIEWQLLNAIKNEISLGSLCEQFKLHDKDLQDFLIKGCLHYWFSGFTFT